jgi:hypothetical protein
MNALAFSRPSFMLAVGERRPKGALPAVIALPQGMEEGDFERIEAAVRETARGRWFLDEFAQRIRAAETLQAAGAIDRLERRVALNEAASAEAGEHFRRFVSLLAPVVERLGCEAGVAATYYEASPFAASRDEGGACLSSLDAIGALSVADKLKLFR